MHIVSYNADRYESIAEAATEPEGLAVLGIMFEVNVMAVSYTPSSLFHHNDLTECVCFSVVIH